MKKGLKKVKASLLKNKLIVLPVMLCVLGVLNSITLPQIIHYVVVGVVSLIIVVVSVLIIREMEQTHGRKNH
ncbi:MAG: hypothetical protein ACRCW2_01230 [Cellulosilyticaceae bacterium]